MFRATTILAYKGKNKSAIGGDGQVSSGNTVMKGSTVKIHKSNNGKVLTGSAGSTADVFSLFDMFENLLQGSKGDLPKAAIDFLKEWRRDKYLGELEATTLVLDRKHIFLLSSTGDVLEPEGNQIVAMEDGGNYALSTTKALKKHAQNLGEEELVKSSLQIAGETCVYMNTNIKAHVTEDEK